LDGTISVRGVHMPNRKDINDPIIEELEKYGLMCVETEEWNNVYFKINKSHCLKQLY